MSAKKRTKWHEWQREFLRSNYSSMKVSDIAKEIGKSESSIMNEANRLKLKKKLSSIDRIVFNKYKGTTSEKTLLSDIAAALNEFGFLWGSDLIEYIEACSEIGRSEEEGPGRKPGIINIEKIYNYIIKEQNRVINN